MKRSAIWCAFCALVLISLTAFAYRPARVEMANVIDLPVEVYEAKAARGIKILEGSTPATLCIRTHQAGYHFSEEMYGAGWDQRDDAASIRVGGSAFVGDWNENAVYVEGAEIGGVGGAMHTQWICFAAESFGGELVGGTTHVAFLFHGRDNGPSVDNARSGYRVLDIDVRSEGTRPTDGVSLLLNTKSYADPTTWSAPVGGNAANGEAIWRNADLTELNGEPLDPHISCSSCHVENGYDLSYFAYSNNVIIKRVVDHGLTWEEGEDVAAYIRQHNAENEYARPWSPLFQPGPGLKARGDEYWSAGAGIDWVLSSDDETAEWMFPTATGALPNRNPSEADMRRALYHGSWSDTVAVADRQANAIPLQEIPIAMQYPDWNNWLPDVHPITAYGYSDWSTHPTAIAATQFETAFDTPAQVTATINQDRSTLICTQSCGASGFGDLTRHFNFGVGGELENRFDILWSQNPATYYLARQSLMQWMNVKQWGEFQQNDLFDLGERLTNGLIAPAQWHGGGNPIRLIGSEPGDQDPAFFFPGVANSTYGTAPHINSRCYAPPNGDCGDGGYDNAGPVGPPGERMIEGYMSAVWYDVQALTSQEQIGWPSNNGGAPVDWNYLTDHNAGIMGHIPGYSQYWRLFSRRVMASQSRNNYYSQATTHWNYAFNGGPGFTATNANFWEVHGRSTGTGTGGRYNQYAADQTMTWRAMEAYWSEWARFAASAPVAWYDRAAEPTAEYESANVVPMATQGSYQFDAYQDANNAYHLALLMQSRGMSAGAIADVARFGEMMWPLGDWEQWLVAPVTNDARAERLMGPNPASHTVRFPAEWTGELYDILGREVMSFEGARTLDVSSLPNGVYIVRTDEGTRRLTIQR